MAEALDAAISESLPELKAFMPGPTDNHGLKETRGLHRSIGTEWETGESFQYATGGARRRHDRVVAA